MSSEDGGLREIWRVRNATADALALGEELMQRAIRAASVEQLAAMIEACSPARSTGPEWTRTFEPLVERLWLWRNDATMAALAALFRVRGLPWAAVSNAFAPEHGARIRADLRQPAWARLPAFAIV